MSSEVCPGCGEPVMSSGDLSATVSCGGCRATIIPGNADHLTIVSTNAATVGGGTASEIPLTGQFLKRYELQQLLGSGTAGAVYQARHRESGAPRAVKILMGKGADKERFLREARMLESIRHPALIQLYEAGEMDGHPYLVLELAAGGSLRKRLKEGPRYTLRESVELMYPMLQGLQACHEKGIIHRDLKPDNILLAGKTTGKIADLGVALLESASRLTATGALVGTPMYMAPEQLQAQDVDVTADLHSMGLILYELLTGDLPYKGRNLGELLTAKLTHVPPPLQTVVPDLPPRITAVLESALEKAPAKRPRSAADFAQELERGLSGPASRARPPAAKPAAPKPPPVSAPTRAPARPPPTSRNAQVIGIGIASVALIAGALLFRPGPAKVDTPASLASPSPSVSVPAPPTPSPTQLAVLPPTPSPSAAVTGPLVTYPPPEESEFPLRTGLEGARIYGRGTLPSGLLVSQRFSELLSLSKSGELAALWKSPESALTWFHPRTLEVKGSAPLPPGVVSLATDAAGERVFAGTATGDLYDASRAAGQPSRWLGSANEPVAALAVLDRATFVVGHGSTLESRAIADGKRLRTASWDSAVATVACANDRLAVGLAGGDLVLFDPKAWDAQRRVTIGRAIVQSRFMPGGQQVIAGDGGNDLAIVDFATGKLTRAFKADAAIRKFALSDDGATLVTATERAADLWDFATRARVHTFATRDLPLHSVSFAERDQCVAVVADLEESTSVPTSELLIFDVKSRKPVQLTGSLGPVRRCAYSTDGRTLLTSGDHPPGDEQPGLIGWDTATAASRFSFTAPASYVLFSDFTSKTFFMSQGGLEQRDLTYGRVLNRYEAAPVMIDLTLDESRLVVLGEGGEAHLIDRKGKKPLWRSKAGYSAVHLSRDGKSVTLLRVTGPEKDEAGSWSRPEAVAEVWDPARNAIAQSQKLEFFGPDNRSAFRPIAMQPAGRPAFGALANQALAGLPVAEQGRIPREALPMSAASQVTLHRAGEHVFALRMPRPEPGPARGVLHWLVGHGETPDIWMPDRASPFGAAELTSLAVSPDGRRLAVGTSMAAILELDIDKLWPPTARR